MGYYTRVNPLVWKLHHQCLCNHPICWDGSKTYLKPTKQMCAVWAWSLFSDFISSGFLSLKIALIFHSCFIESLANCWTKLLGGFNPSETYLSNGIIVPNIWKNVPNHQPEKSWLLAGFWCNSCSVWFYLVHGVHFLSKIGELVSQIQWPIQEPIYWTYRFHI